MTISMHAASVPVFQQLLGSLDQLLAKAEAHVIERKIDPDALLQARLFPDMFPLLKQVQIACDFAKGVCGRLAGAELPVFDDTEKSFAELRTLVARHRQPDGLLIRSWPTRSMALWVMVMLLTYLLIYYLGR